MSGAARGWLGRIEQGLGAVLRWGSILSLLVLFLLLTGGVAVRFVPVTSLGWADEIVELFFAWMVFLGTAALWREEKHIAVDFVLQGLAGSALGRALALFVGVLSLGFLAVFTWEGWHLAVQAGSHRTPILELPKLYWYAALPVAGVLMIGYTLRRCLRAIRPPREDSGRA